MSLHPAARALLLAAIGLAVFPGAVRSAGPARPASQLPGYEIMALGRGHYNRLTLVLTAEGKKGIAILDTGASGTLLSAERFGFLLGRALPAGVPAKARVNDLLASVAVARELQIGSLKVTNLPLRIVSAKHLHDHEMLYENKANYAYDAILGGEVLHHYNAMIDCDRLILYLNTDRSKMAQMGPAMTAAGWTRVPMTEAGTQFTVPCTLEGKPFNLLVDTGAPFTTLDKAMLDGAHVTTNDIHMLGGLIGDRAPTRSDLVMSSRITIGDFTALNVHMMSSKNLSETFQSLGGKTPGTPVIGLLGGDILSRNHAIIDYGGRALYLKH